MIGGTMQVDKRSAFLIAVILAVSFMCAPSFCEDEKKEEKRDALSPMPGLPLPGLNELNPLNLFSSGREDGAVLDGVMTKNFYTDTDDNWKIAITRYIAVNESGEPQPGAKAAVILCHGFNFSNLFWDLDEAHSLPRFLAKNGYDVWSVSLRGSGASSKPVIADIRSVVKLDIGKLPEQIANVPSNITKFDWTIDDHIQYDLPAVIKFVKEQSGKPKVYWIGHSMGGIVMYGYLETVEQESIAGFIPVGSMTKIPHPLSTGLQSIAEQKPLMTASLIINTSVASQMRNWTFGAVKNPIEELLFNGENMEPEVVSKLFGRAVEDTSPGVVRQFADSIKAGEMLSADLQYSYAANVNKVTVPVCFIGGFMDGFVALEALRYAYDTVASRDKVLHIFSLANSYSANYGHSDLLLGPRAKEEVYPVILKWLDDRARPQ